MNSRTDALIASTNLREYLEAGGGNSSANQRIVGDLAKREVLYCVSSLVSTIAAVAAEHGKFGDTDYDEILNLQEGKPDYESAASEAGWVSIDEIDESLLRSVFDYIEAKSEDEEVRPDTMRGELRDVHGVSFVQLSRGGSKSVVDTSDMENWQQLCDSQSIEPDRLEVFEHWIVTNWAEAKLKEHGECVGDIEGMTVWGRTTTGQSMCLDHVWESIAAEMQILHGQAHDWAEERR